MLRKVETPRALCRSAARRLKAGFLLVNLGVVFRRLGDPYKALAAYDLRKGVNWSDAKSVSEYRAKLADLNKGADEEEEGGHSNQGTHERGETKMKKGDESKVVGLSKEDSDLLNAGRKVGQLISGTATK